MQPETTTSSPDPDRPGIAARLGSTLLWVVLPGLVLLLVAGYIAAATIGHVNPPVVPVSGLSMRPTLQAGDLVFLEGVDPKTLRKGDIIAVNVSPADRSQYNLPAHIVHRIIKVGHDARGLVFTTKGDANSGADVFTTHANDVIGELRFHVTGLGYPFLFFRSRQGEIFLVAAALLALLYFGLGVVEDRRITVEGTAATMQNVLEETNELRVLLDHAHGTGSVAGRTPEERHEFDRLAEDVSASRAAADETARTMRELVGAIGEYGEHLRSHTAVMQNLAATTTELRRAAERLGGAPGLPQQDPAVAGDAPASSAPLPPLDLFDELPVSLSPDLLTRRASLAARTERIDDLLRGLPAARPDAADSQQRPGRA
ncbi:MAG TPA: signal peptidase I [Gaiellaceae bacterium]|nr:signal peptidase I [Gaiellaceae bacterium]